MDILKTLTDLGFSNAAILNPDQGLAKIRTDKGWVYQRFANEQEIAAWAKNRKPETN
jgi:hypothetical protein